MFKHIVKSIAKALLGPYRLLRIYRVDLGSLPPSGDTTEYDLHSMASSDEMLLAEDPVIRRHAFFAEGKSYAFGLWENGKLVCSCVVWDRGRFADPAIGSLRDNEGILVDVITAASYRRRRFAWATIRFAMTEMARKGYESLVCTIWHNNLASMRAFEKAGWQCTAFAIEIFPFGQRLTLRFAKPRPRIRVPAGRALEVQKETDNSYTGGAHP